MKSRFIAAVAGALGLAAATPAFAQASSYDLGAVWYVTSVDVEPGQFETYMDYLKGEWVKANEFGRQQGILLGYHVLSVNNARQGEPDLFLVIVNKDYMTKAQGLEFEKKLNAHLATDRRKDEAASAGRAPMRTIMGDMQLQELVFTK